MKKSNLIKILSTFAPNEIREFADYIHSPFFNKNKSVVKIFSYVRSMYPAFNEESISKKTVWKKSFPDAGYNDGLLRIQMFTLTNLAIDYLRYKELSNDKLQNGNHLLRILNDRNLDKQFNKVSAQVSAKLIPGSYQSEMYYYSKYRYQYENVFYQHKRYFDRKEKLADVKGISSIAHYATLFQVIVMLKTYLYFLNTKQIYETAADTSEFEDFLRNLDIKKYNTTHIIPLLYYTIKLHTDENNAEHFKDIRRVLFSNFSEFHIFDSVEVIINMENYCKKMIRKGKNEYLKQLFDIYNFELEHKTYKSELSLSERMYISITETAITLGKIDWAEDFIKKYKNELNAKVKDGISFYAGSLVEFSRGNFKGAKELLLKAGYTDVYNKFEVKNLLISCYYELDMFDEMEGMIDSYRHILKSDKYMSNERKKYYANYILIAKKMIKLKTHFTPLLAARLRKMLQQPGFVIGVNWLESKIAEAENRYGRKH
ncbi:MAG: hypothetical protein IAE90_08730 [Ignavibacteria bacterium]|nr:hypothetical protein [Ignavibacteria bacterium]